MLVQSANQIDVYLEVGTKRVFAGALDWPGWIRNGNDEQTALQALFEYAPRYAHVLNVAQLPFPSLSDVSAFNVIEQLNGNAMTDFGSPNIALTNDTTPIDEAELVRIQKLLRACWQTFDATAQAASDKALSKGSRGGGRDLERIIHHVLDVDSSSLSQLGWKFQRDTEAEVARQFDDTRQAILDGLVSAAHGELPTRGPRGGIRCTPRYFIRRVSWHVLDHTWEIEDRV